VRTYSLQHRQTLLEEDLAGGDRPESAWLRSPDGSLENWSVETPTSHGSSASSKPTGEGEMSNGREGQRILRPIEKKCGE